MDPPNREFKSRDITSSCGIELPAVASVLPALRGSEGGRGEVEEEMRLKRVKVRGTAVRWALSALFYFVDGGWRFGFAATASSCNLFLLRLAISERRKTKSRKFSDFPHYEKFQKVTNRVGNDDYLLVTCQLLREFYICATENEILLNKIKYNYS